MVNKRLRYVALALGAAWVCWWVCFEAAEAVGDRQVMQAIIFMVVMFGAVLFLVEGIGAIVMFAPMWAYRFRLAEFLALFAMMPLPPLAAGILLLLSRRTARAHERAIV